MSESAMKIQCQCYENEWKLCEMGENGVRMSENAMK